MYIIYHKKIILIYNDIEMKMQKCWSALRLLLC